MSRSQFDYSIQKGDCDLFGLNFWVGKFYSGNYKGLNGVRQGVHGATARSKAKSIQKHKKPALPIRADHLGQICRPTKE